MKWLWNELVVPLQHAVTDSASQMFCQQRGTLGFWTRSEQLWKSWLANLTRSICCNASFCILLRGDWSWDQIQLGQMLYKCGQQVIKSFLFSLGNIKVLGCWWVGLENGIPPSPFLIQLSYRCDLKEPCLEGLGYEWLHCKVTEIAEVQTLRSEDKTRVGASHSTRHPDHHRGLDIDLAEQWSERVWHLLWPSTNACFGLLWK